MIRAQTCQQCKGIHPVAFFPWRSKLKRERREVCATCFNSNQRIAKRGSQQAKLARAMAITYTHALKPMKPR